jgi:hypothetical protein
MIKILKENIQTRVLMNISKRKKKKSLYKVKKWNIRKYARKIMIT